ncbi:hypothetical protein CFC21_100072 [Triticum aestivum]|uniref:Uncharacterized protein n=2 Tax=Triticum aestivum TaxID=4565 RepID=A0A3B6RMD2_WHEAT|nr:hypothetical protein CFC21_100072 [Triticum aestivum]
MANTTKVAAIFGVLVLLQVSCAAGRHVQVKDSGERVHDAPAVMSLTDFHSGPAACDGKSHSNDLLLASLTSAWYGGGIRCGKMIRIVTTRGVAVEAMVVEECDIEQGCGEHEISTSAAVWKALGVDVGIGELPVTWSDLD